MPKKIKNSEEVLQFKPITIEVALVQYHEMEHVALSRIGRIDWKRNPTQIFKEIVVIDKILLNCLKYFLGL